MLCGGRISRTGRKCYLPTFYLLWLKSEFSASLQTAKWTRFQQQKPKRPYTNLNHCSLDDDNQESSLSLSLSDVTWCWLPSSGWVGALQAGGGKANRASDPQCLAQTTSPPRPYSHSVCAAPSRATSHRRVATHHHRGFFTSKQNKIEMFSWILFSFIWRPDKYVLAALWGNTVIWDYVTDHFLPKMLNVCVSSAEARLAACMCNELFVPAGGARIGRGFPLKHQH